jgi:hypothetical protein
MEDGDIGGKEGLQIVARGVHEIWFLESAHV